jgi:hypothetical protein
MRRGVPVAAAAALAVPAAAAALAQAASYDSNVTINYARGGPYFAGRVGSAQAVCAKHRKVTVYRSAPGADPGIGSDVSSPTGNWRLNLARRPRAGFYYAKAKSRTLGPAGSRTVCRAAKSAVTRAS